MDRAELTREIQAMRAVLERVEFKEWDESQHPRNERGEFSSGGGGGATTPSSSPPPDHSDAAHNAVAQVPHTGGDPNADGSMAHPIYVDGDLDHAVREIHAGHHVRLDQARQVVTLTDKLGDMAEDAVAKGEKAPTYDLGLVTVPGTNLFTQQSLGIPRVQMPQLSGPPTKGSPADDESKYPKNSRGSVNLGEAFRDELEHQGFKVTDGRVPAESLRATQMDLVGPQVAGMADALEQGKLNIRPIFVSKDDYVVDGHHQWAATVLANLRAGKTKFDLPVQRVDADIGTILDTSREYTTAMGIAQKAGTAKMLEAILKVLAVQGPGQWVAMDPLLARVLKFREDQARDESGRWTVGGGGGSVQATYADPKKVAAMSEQDFKDHPPKGFKYDAGLGHEGQHGRGGGSDITLGSEFFDLDNRQREAVIHHEIGHGLSDEMLKDGSAFDLADQGAMGAKGKNGEIWGVNGQTTPGEIVAEAYSVLHDEPSFMADKFPALGKAVIGKADQYGYPISPEARSALATKTITGYRFSEHRLAQIRRFQLRVGGEDLLG